MGTRIESSFGLLYIMEPANAMCKNKHTHGLHFLNGIEWFVWCITLSWSMCDLLNLVNNNTWF